MPVTRVHDSPTLRPCTAQPAPVPRRRRGTFQVFALFAPENVDKVEAAVREEIARVLADGFTADEIVESKEERKKR